MTAQDSRPLPAAHSRRASISITRRGLLRGTFGAAAAVCSASYAPAVFAQPRVLRVTQLLDTSPDQQELSRDYSTGIRLAFAEAKQRGLNAPQLATVETDGTPDALRTALRAIKADATQAALVGAVGERLAIASVELAHEAKLDIAHVAPWLADTRHDRDDQVVPLFASREEQLGHAIRSLATTGVVELGLVYAGALIGRTLQAQVGAIAGRLNLRTRSYIAPNPNDLAGFGAALAADAPPFLLFLGGSIELAQFTQGLSRQKRQRYVICLSDVDTTTLLQLGPGAGVPLIFTQVVPNAQASPAPVVREYRASLKDLYDEAPSPVSLAGYLAGRYVTRALAGVDAAGGRAAVLAELRRRRPVDLDGYRLDFAAGMRGSSFVSQTLLGANGRLIG